MEVANRYHLREHSPIFPLTHPHIVVWCCLMLFDVWCSLMQFVWCCLMLFDAVWCCLMLFDAVWCCLMLFDAVWCCLMLFDAVWCCLMLFDAVWCCLMLFDAIWCCLMLFDAVWCCFYLYIIYHIPLDHHELAGPIPYEITIQQTRFSSVCTLIWRRVPWYPGHSKSRQH